MSDSELGRKWDRCLADTVVKMGKRLLAPGGRRPEPGSQLRAPLTWRAEGKLRERSGRPACSSPSGQGQVPEPGREVTRAGGGRAAPGERSGVAAPRRWGGWVGRWHNRVPEARNSPWGHISRTGSGARSGGHGPPQLKVKCLLKVVIGSTL